MERKTESAKAAAPAKAKKKKTVQNLYNNLRYIGGRRYGADQARFIISELKKETGIPQQRALVELVLAGFESSDFVAPYREKIRKAWMDVKPLADPFE